MAAGTPLTRLALGAGSVADDLGFVALNDLAGALGGHHGGLPRHRRSHGHDARREMAAGGRPIP